MLQSSVEEGTMTVCKAKRKYDLSIILSVFVKAALSVPFPISKSSFDSILPIANVSLNIHVLSFGN